MDQAPRSDDKRQSETERTQTPARAAPLDPGPQPDAKKPSEIQKKTEAQERQAKWNGFKERLAHASLADWLMVIFTAVIAFWAGLQWKEMHETGKQTEALINSATKQAGAADSFAKTADAIKTEIDTAVSDVRQIGEDTLRQSESNFRQDERPYLTFGPAGDIGSIEIAQNGPYVGHLAVEVHLGSYGKSPAFEIGRDARLASNRK